MTGTATCRTSGRASSTAIASTARTTRRSGHRFNPNKVVLDPYAKAIGRDVTWDDAMFGYTIGQPQADLSFDDARQRAVRPACRGRRHGVHLGRRPAAAHAVAQDGHLRVHVKGFTKLQPRAAGADSRHLRGARDRRGDQPSAEARRHGGRAAAGAPPLDDRHLVERGLHELLGLQHARRSSRPNMRYAADRAAGGHGARVQEHGARAARRRHRGDPRRRLQPHRRGQPARADAVAARHRQRRLLPPRRREPALLHGLHRLRQHAEHAAARRCCSSSWTACATGCSRCTSTASASTWPARSRASCTRWTGSARSSTSSTRTRCCRR